MVLSYTDLMRHPRQGSRVRRMKQSMFFLHYGIIIFHYTSYLPRNFIFLMVVFERERASTGEGERQGDRESQAVSAVSTEPNVGLKLMNHEIMT